MNNISKIIFFFITPIILFLCFAVFFITPLAIKQTNRWFESDIETSSTRISNTLQYLLIDLIEQNDKVKARGILSEAAQDDQLIAIALCDRDQSFFAKTLHFSSQISCSLNELSLKTELSNKEVFLRSKSLFDKNKVFRGQLILIYNLSYIESRNGIIKRYFRNLFVGIGTILTILISISSIITTSKQESKIVPSSPPR